MLGCSKWGVNGLVTEFQPASRGVLPISQPACPDLTECEIEQIRAETVGLLRAMLPGQIGLPELPGNFDNRDADGAGLPVNG
jgi:hypothetical protein